MDLGCSEGSQGYIDYSLIFLEVMNVMEEDTEEDANTVDLVANSTENMAEWEVVVEENTEGNMEGNMEEVENMVAVDVDTKVTGEANMDSDMGDGDSLALWEECLAH